MLFLFFFSLSRAHTYTYGSSRYITHTSPSKSRINIWTNYHICVTAHEKPCDPRLMNSANERGRGVSCSLLLFFLPLLRAVCSSLKFATAFFCSVKCCQLICSHMIRIEMCRVHNLKVPDAKWNYCWDSSYLRCTKEFGSCTRVLLPDIYCVHILFRDGPNSHNNTSQSVLLASMKKDPWIFPQNARRCKMVTIMAR